MAESFRVHVEVEGTKETLRAFRELPKEASDALRERTLKLSESLADDAQSSMRSDSRQSALVSSTVKVNRDRIPAISVGGAKRVGTNKQPAHKILFGAEFGSNSLSQFRRRTTEGYAIFPTIEREKAKIEQAWNDVADEIVAEFTKDGA